ncbi:MAG: polyphenol oxidase family protein [Rubrobacteraceae bacterium]
MTFNRTEQTASGTVKTAAGGAVFVEPHPTPEGAKVWFFTRMGGVSEPPFDSLNTSRKAGDDPDAVEENLSRIREAMDGRTSAWVKQVAGDTALRVSEGGFAGEADALVTSERDLSLVVGVADCVPVALVGKSRVGMVHSGWRGTLSGISGKAVREIGEDGSAAYIGPCIRRCCYEVSDELAQEFVSEFGDEVVSGGHLSLPDAIRIDLHRAGIEEIHDLGLCTGCRPDLFFSHRKQKPVTGRSLAAVAKVDG